MKQGFMKTVEVLFVIVLTSIFLFVMVPELTMTEEVERFQDILINLEENPDFRNFVVANNGCYNSSNTTVDSYITQYIEDEYDYLLCINRASSGFGARKVVAETLFIAGNITNYQQRTVRLYYWTR